MTPKNIDYSLTINDTNVLKGIAICAMLWHHLFIGQPNFGTFANTLAQACNICVAMFLFLSGYGLTVQYERQKTNGFVNNICSTIKFLSKRYIKFYLNYWIIFAVAIPLGVFVFGRTFQIAYGSEIDMPGFAILDFLGLMGKQSYNATWWFNRIILFFYFFFPFLYLGMKRIFIGIPLLILLYVWPNSIMYLFEELDIGFPMYFYIFATGIFCACHKVLLNKIFSRANNRVILCVTILEIALSFTLWKFGTIPTFQITTWDTIATLFISLLVVASRQRFNNCLKPLQFLGKHSMNMYLTHTFILGYFFSNFIYGFKYPILIFGVLLGCSLLFSICLEFIKNKVGFYKLQNNIVDWISNLHLTR